MALMTVPEPTVRSRSLKKGSYCSFVDSRPWAKIIVIPLGSVVAGDAVFVYM